MMVPRRRICLQKKINDMEWTATAYYDGRGGICSRKRYLSVSIGRTMPRQPQSGGFVIFPAKRYRKTWYGILFPKQVKLKGLRSAMSRTSFERWTVGHFCHDIGQELSPGESYWKESACVEVPGIDADALVSLAKDLCKALKQRFALVKDNADGKLYRIFGKDR